MILIVFLAVSLIFVYYTRMAFPNGSYGEMFYEDVLLRRLDSLEVKVITIKLVSRSPLRQILVYRVNFVTRRGHNIDGYFLVGHSLFGIMCKHIRFKMHIGLPYEK
jgi:hypothetical protein